MTADVKTAKAAMGRMRCPTCRRGGVQINLDFTLRKHQVPESVTPCRGPNEHQFDWVLAEADLYVYPDEFTVARQQFETRVETRGVDTIDRREQFNRVSDTHARIRAAAHSDHHVDYAS